MDVAGNIILTEPKNTARRVSIKGLSYLMTYASGKELLVVGPSSAGKTKFAEYLRLGVLGPENSRYMTYHVAKSPAFVIRLGPQRNQTLRIRRAVDTPGQTGPIQHASLVGRRKPHFVIVILDCSKPLFSTLKWFRLFCDRLDTVLRKGPYAHRKLSNVLVVLNKRDKIDSRQADRLRQEVNVVLRRYLSVVLGVDRLRTVAVLECVAVENPEGNSLIEEIIRQLAEQLAH